MRPRPSIARKTVRRTTHQAPPSSYLLAPRSKSAINPGCTGKQPRRPSATAALAATMHARASTGSVLLALLALVAAPGCLGRAVWEAPDAPGARLVRRGSAADVPRSAIRGAAIAASGHAEVQDVWQAASYRSSSRAGHASSPGSPGRRGDAAAARSAAMPPQAAACWSRSRHQAAAALLMRRQTPPPAGLSAARRVASATAGAAGAAATSAGATAL